jgi:KaiC/GvpD/RAD55 family RecA-like ATPase
VTPQDEATLSEVLSPDPDWGSVLISGPAMTGKQSLGVELLATANSAGGQPIAITAADTAEQMRTAYLTAGGEATDNLAVIDCLPGTDESGTDAWTRSIGSPGDFTGIAMAVSDVFKNISENRQSGARVLVDNLATSLVYTDIKPLYRFLHALVGRVTANGGAVIATLDTDGTGDAERQALVGLFDTVVEVRRADDATKFRVVGREDVPDHWHYYTSGGDDA